MIYNITLETYLKSELINSGYNEFISKGKIIAFDNDKSIIRKILRYDKDIEKIVNENIFYDLKLNDQVADRKFKRQFVSRFLNHSFNSQTIESFASSVMNVFLNNIDFLNMYYENIDEFLTGKSTSLGDTDTKRNTNNRMANATLPQTEINIDVDNTILDYADNNSISKNKEESKTKQDMINNKYDIDTLDKSMFLLEKVFDEFEKKCFLFIW